jgi:hypothetical protein
MNDVPIWLAIALVFLCVSTGIFALTAAWELWRNR